jgi:hypothetical protein
MGTELLLSSSEVLRACVAIGVAPPLLLARSAGRDATGAAASSLDVGPAVPAEIQASLRVLGEPDVVVMVQARVAGAARYVVLGMRGPDAALHQPIPGDLHRIGSLDPDEVPAVAAGTAGLADRPYPGDVRLTVAAADLRVAAERASRGRVDEAAMALRGAGGAKPDAAAVLASALGAVDGVASVTILCRRTSTRTDGLTLGWLDCGAGGLWRIEGPNLATGSDPGGVTPATWYETPATVSAVTADELNDGIRAGVADACGAETALGRSSQVR